MRVVAQTVISVISEGRFPQDTLMNKYGAMRSVMIVNRRALPRLPAEHEHLDMLVAHNPVPAIVAGFETQIRQQFIRRDRSAGNQFTDFRKGRNVLSRQ